MRRRRLSGWILIAATSAVALPLIAQERSGSAVETVSQQQEAAPAAEQAEEGKKKKGKATRSAEADAGKKAKGKKEKGKSGESKVSAKKSVKRGLEWLVEAQHESGGWGAGSHAAQHIRDPFAVQTDPATTAFAATTLIKAGHTPKKGAYRDAVIKATEYLVKAVEEAEPKSKNITSLTNTQPQRKLGPQIDTAMTAQFLTRISEMLPEDGDLKGRVDEALGTCIARLQDSQNKDGSWNAGGGWAPVLLSAMNCSSLEMAKAAGVQVDGDKLQQARRYQKLNVNADTGGAVSTASAGVELYAFAGGFRGNAADASQAQQAVEEAKEAGQLDAAAPVDDASIRIAVKDEVKAKKLIEAVAQNSAQLRRLNDEKLLAGFGNNGGEEFLSYLMTSESLVIAGGDKWDKWNDKMKDRLGRIQNGDGSWSGHHCITSPVFCTSAALQVMLTEKDVDMLKRIAKVTE